MTQLSKDLDLQSMPKTRMKFLQCSLSCCVASVPVAQQHMHSKLVLSSECELANINREAQSLDLK